MKHCPICNKSSSEIKFYGEFCADCAGDKVRGRLPREAEVTVCKSCGNIKVAGAFVPETHASVERLLKSAIKHYPIRLMHSGNGIARLAVSDPDREGLEVQANVHLKAIRVLCDACSKKRAGYYEAVVQLRGEKEKVARTSESLSRYLERNGAFVTKVEEKEHGLDIYASDKRVVQAYISARHLKPKTAFELHGEKAGRKLYRNTYFLPL